MYKLLIVFALIVAPSLAFGQTDKNKTTDTKIEVVAPIQVALKKIEPISVNPKVQSFDFSHKKSEDITSIKTYIRILQLKRKETVLA